MFVIVCIFIGFKIYDYIWMEIVTAGISGIISFILAGYVKPQSYGLALAYGVSWLAVGVILDVIVTMRFNPAIFKAWTFWLGYGLAILALFLRVKKAPVATVTSPPPQV